MPLYSMLEQLNKSVKITECTARQCYIHVFMHVIIEVCVQVKVFLPRIHLELGVSHLTGADEKVVQMKSELQLLQPQVLGKAEVQCPHIHTSGNIHFSPYSCYSCGRNRFSCPK